MSFTSRLFRRALLLFSLSLASFFPSEWAVLVPFAQARGGACSVEPNLEWTNIEKRVWETMCRDQQAFLTQTSVVSPAKSYFAPSRPWPLGICVALVHDQRASPTPLHDIRQRTSLLFPWNQLARPHDS